MAARHGGARVCWPLKATGKTINKQPKATTKTIETKHAVGNYVSNRGDSGRTTTE